MAQAAHAARPIVAAAVDKVSVGVEVSIGDKVSVGVEVSIGDKVSIGLAEALAAL
jgi:UDP-3-O-[3-hydroxymyristoyl] glucosamine N-acyltransferase